MFSLAEWIGEHSTSWWGFYDDEIIMAWLEDGRIIYEEVLMSDLLTEKEINRVAPGFKDLAEWEYNQRIVLCNGIAEAQAKKLLEIELKRDLLNGEGVKYANRCLLEMR